MFIAGLELFKTEQVAPAVSAASKYFSQLV